MATGTNNGDKSRQLYFPNETRFIGRLRSTRRGTVYDHVYKTDAEMEADSKAKQEAINLVTQAEKVSL